MAAAIIPIITSLLPVIVPSLVQGVEALFGKQTGPAKMQAVLNALQSLIADLGKAGLMPSPPSPDALMALIETVVQDLKGKGQLPAPAGTPPITSLAGMTFQVTGTMKVAQ